MLSSLYPTLLQNPAPFPALSQGPSAQATSTLLLAVSQSHLILTVTVPFPHSRIAHPFTWNSLVPGSFAPSSHTLLIQVTHLHSCKAEGEVTILVFNTETDLKSSLFPLFPKRHLDILFQETSAFSVLFILFLPVVYLKVMPAPSPSRLRRVRVSRALLPCSAA